MVLTQLDEENRKFDVVAYASQSNSQTKVKYNSYEYKGECLASMWVVATFQYYLFSSPFILVTNHQPLKWLMEFD
jgi:hypothetical protein